MIQQNRFQKFIAEKLLSIQPSPAKTNDISPSDIFHVSFALPEIPTLRETASKDYILFGEKNLYPQKLYDIVSKSSTQMAIINTKAQMMSGRGLLINGAKTMEESMANFNKLDPNIQKSYTEFLENKNGNGTIQDIMLKLSFDYQLYGAYSLETIYSMDFSNIAALKYVDNAAIRSGKFKENKIDQYWHSRDWNYFTKKGFVPTSIAAFDAENNEDYNQLIYVKSGNMEYYGVPSYSSSIAYVQIEAELATFHLNNITNAFNPGVLLTFYADIENQEEKAEVKRKVEQQYGGVTNTNKLMVIFAKNKDAAPKLEAIPNTNIEKQYEVTNATTVQKILTGNSVTSPALFGIPTPTGISNGNELMIAYNIFNQSIMVNDRMKLEQTLNKILKINKLPITVEIMAFNPLVDESQYSNHVVRTLASLPANIAEKVIATMSVDEIRALANLPLLTSATQSAPPQNNITAK